MTLSMYQASVPAFKQMLENLSAILDAAAAHAAKAKFDPAVLLQTRLAPDMLPLVSQVQIATDHAKGASGRLARVDLPKYPDEEKTIDELKQRIAKTLAFVAGLKPAQFEGSEDIEVVLTLGGGPRRFTGRNYLVNFALPNFYFHVTTAYDILRHSGVPVGKRDFIGLAHLGAA